MYFPKEVLKNIVSYSPEITQVDKIRKFILDEDFYVGNNKDEYLEYLRDNVIQVIFNSEEWQPEIDGLMLPWESDYKSRWDMLWYVYEKLDDYGCSTDDKNEYRNYIKLSRTYAYFKAEEIIFDLVELKYPN